MYNIAVALRMSGRLDVDALTAAMADVIDRHESLRTLFPATHDAPQQLVVAAEQAEFDWQIVDSEGWPRDELDTAVDAAAHHAFDLTSEIPLRATLFRLGPDEHLLVGVLHHIAADGWSIGPLMRDLGEAYAARRLGRGPDWAELPVQYADYTLWQHAQFGDLDDPDSPIASQLTYWVDALAGLPEVLPLPTDRPYPPVADQHKASVAVQWPAELQQRVRQVAREHNATSFMVVQAALAALLSTVSASSDVAVGFPIAGRRDPALDDLVGFFVNTLVLRVDVAGDPTVAELLAQVRQRSLAAYEHQDVDLRATGASPHQQGARGGDDRGAAHAQRFGQLLDSADHGRVQLHRRGRLIRIRPRGGLRQSVIRTVFRRQVGVQVSLVLQIIR